MSTLDPAYGALLQLLHRTAARRAFIASVRTTLPDGDQHETRFDYYSDGRRFVENRPHRLRFTREFDRVSGLQTTSSLEGGSTESIDGPLFLPPQMALFTPTLMPWWGEGAERIQPAGLQLHGNELTVRFVAFDEAQPGVEFMLGGVTFDLDRGLGTSMSWYGESHEVVTFSDDLPRHEL